jgi:DNA-nicking Smr family endonuclease
MRSAVPKRRSEGRRPAKKPEPFHAPFRELRARIPEPEPPPPAPAPPPPAPRAESDEDLFRSAVEGARPLAPEDRALPPRAPKPSPRPGAASEETEALARLADLCAGSGPFDFADTSEYIEGAAPGIDHKLVRRLRKGDFSVQGHLDLHGMNRDEAREAVEKFVVAARTRGMRCILLIHGRGHNSKDHIPVLKQLLNAWLRRGKLGKQVLAFATALPHDGGAGALYVLLRR